AAEDKRPSFRDRERAGVGAAVAEVECPALHFDRAGVVEAVLNVRRPRAAGLPERARVEEGGAGDDLLAVHGPVALRLEDGTGQVMERAAEAGGQHARSGPGRAAMVLDGSAVEVAARDIHVPQGDEPAAPRNAAAGPAEQAGDDYLGVPCQDALAEEEIGKDRVRGERHAPVHDADLPRDGERAGHFAGQVQVAAAGDPSPQEAGVTQVGTGRNREGPSTEAVAAQPERAHGYFDYAAVVKGRFNGRRRDAGRLTERAGVEE